MSRKWRLTAWAIYTVATFALMMIGFNWEIALPVSVVVGFVCGLFNEIIQMLLLIYKHMGGVFGKNKTITTPD
jgi:hypothetical protein